MTPGRIPVEGWRLYTTSYVASPLLLRRDRGSFMLPTWKVADFEGLAPPVAAGPEAGWVGYEVDRGGQFGLAKPIVGTSATNFESSFFSRGDGGFISLSVYRFSSVSLTGRTSFGTYWARAHDADWNATNLHQFEYNLATLPNFGGFRTGNDQAAVGLFRHDSVGLSTNTITFVDYAFNPYWKIQVPAQSYAVGTLSNAFLIYSDYDESQGTGALVLKGVDSEGSLKWVRRIRFGIAASLPSIYWCFDNTCTRFAASPNGRISALLIKASEPTPLYISDPVRGEQRLPDGAFVLLVMDAAGGVRYARALPDLAGQWPMALCLDDLGNCFLGLAGQYRAAPGDAFGNDATRDGKPCFSIMKHGPAGDLAWATLLSVPGGGRLSAIFLTPDAAGGALVSGRVSAYAPLSRADLRPRSQDLLKLSDFTFITRFAPQPRLLIRSETGGRVRLVLLCEPLHPWRLEVSEDLQVWSPMGIVSSESGVTELLLEDHRPHGAYFRAGFAFPSDE